jgi:hypothetical protein
MRWAGTPAHSSATALERVDTMLNPISSYEEAGRREATARHQHHDEAGARFESDWAHRAIALETAEDGRIARRAYENAYRMETMRIRA